MSRAELAARVAELGPIIPRRRGGDGPPFEECVIQSGDLQITFRSLRSILDLPKAERKAALIERLDVICALALTVREKQLIPALKCVEAAARIMGEEAPLSLPKGSSIALAAVFAAQGEKDE
jgi:hypothetical protein